MAYERIDWENEPSVNTPINEDNLNHMEDGIVQNETDIAGKMNANNPTGTGSLQVGTGNMKTDGNPSYALGYNAYAEGDNSFAFGSSTRAKKQGAYAIGTHAEAREYFSMALGEEVIAASIHQTVRGKYNEIDADGVYLDIVGGGNPLERKNVETLTPNGDKWVAGDYTNGNGETLHGIYEALPVDSASGNPAVITDAFGGSCKSLKLTLEPIQSGSGTPSPQNVRPISGRTEANVVRTGKNMWNDTDSMLQRMSRNGATYTNTETDTKTAFSARVELMLLNSPAYASTVATISSVGRYSIVVDATNITYDHFRLKHNGSVRDLIISLPFSVKGQLIISFDVDGYNPSVVGGLVIKNIQLENGSTATPYEPFDAQTITRTYGQTVYGGADDVTGDGATVTKGLYVPVVTTVGYSSNASTWYADCYGVTIVEDTPILCNMYDQIGHGNVGAVGKIKVYANAFTIYDDRFTTVANAQAVLDNCQIVYPLATPTSIPLTAQNITLLHGDNVLTTDADSIEASYSADIALYIAKKIAEGSQNNRSLSKGGSGDEEVKEEVKEEEIEIKEAEPLTKEVR